MTTKPRQKFDDLLPAKQAGIICNDTRFQDFATTRCGLPGRRFGPSSAAQYLRDCCQIESRRDLNTSVDAVRKFRSLRTEFDAQHAIKLADFRRRLHLKRTRATLQKCG